MSTIVDIMIVGVIVIVKAKNTYLTKASLNSGPSHRYVAKKYPSRPNFQINTKYCVYDEAQCPRPISTSKDPNIIPVEIH
jgi:hypothetical protein